METNPPGREPSQGELLTWLRRKRKLSQPQLASRAGLAESTVLAIETGRRAPLRRTWTRLLAALGVTPAELARLREWLTSDSPAAPAEVLPVAGSGRAMGREARDTLALLGRRLTEAEQPCAPPRAADRAAVPEFLERLEGRPWALCQALIKESPELHSWALCEWYCATSEAAAPDSPRGAVRNAVLALRIARHVPGPTGWRDRNVANALFHLANARRVLGRLPAAGAALDRAEALWESSAPADPSLLDRSRPLDLAASLRRAQRRLGEAVSLLGRAVALAPPGPATARLLLKQAKVHEERGDFPSALAAVDCAEPHLDDVQAPRHRLVWMFNRSDYLRQLGRQAEAEALLPAVRALAGQLGNDLDRVRLRWLEGRMATTGGRPAEAAVALREVRDAFATRGIPYDLALVSLELAVHLLEQGETGAVRELARESELIFQAQQVERERCGALLLFCQAAEREALTLELVRGLLRQALRAE